MSNFKTFPNLILMRNNMSKANNSIENGLISFFGIIVIVLAVTTCSFDPPEETIMPGTSYITPQEIEAGLMVAGDVINPGLTMLHDIENNMGLIKIESTDMLTIMEEMNVVANRIDGRLESMGERL